MKVAPDVEAVSRGNFIAFQDLFGVVLVVGEDFFVVPGREAALRGAEDHLRPGGTGAAGALNARVLMGASKVAGVFCEGIIAVTVSDALAKTLTLALSLALPLSLSGQFQLDLGLTIARAERECLALPVLTLAVLALPVLTLAVLTLAVLTLAVLTLAVLTLAVLALTVR